MSETIVIDNIIFSYIGSDGKKYYTPSAEFATAQARKYGTEDIFIEKYEKNTDWRCRIGFNSFFFGSAMHSHLGWNGCRSYKNR